MGARKSVASCKPLPVDEKRFFRNLPTLDTPRLQLRKVVLDDAHDMYRYANDPEVSRYVLWDVHRTLADSLSFVRGIIDKYEMGQVAEWCVQEKSTSRMIGTCGFVHMDGEHSRAEIGYALGRRSWGQGYASEAVQAVVKLAFAQLKLNRLEARCMLANAASRRVLEKAGLRHEGILRQHVRRGQQYFDVHLYAMLREDYQANAVGNARMVASR